MRFPTISDAVLNDGLPIAGLRFKERDDYLLELISKGQATAEGVPNGLLDLDRDEDGIPDYWTFQKYPGGSGILVLSEDNLGAGSHGFKMTHPGGEGNGGGILTSGYIEVAELTDYFVSGIAETNGTALIQVWVNYYTAGKVAVSSANLLEWSSSAQSASQFAAYFQPPATTRYITLSCRGGVPTAGTGPAWVRWDAVRLNAGWAQELIMQLGEMTTLSSAWFQRYYVPLSVPVMNGGLILVAVPIEIKSSSGSEMASARLRLAGDSMTGYSNDFSTVSTSYVRGVLTVAAASDAAIGGASGSMGLYIDVKNSSGSTPTWTRSPNCRIITRMMRS